MDITIRNSRTERSIDSRLNNAGMTDTEGRSVIPDFCSQESMGGDCVIPEVCSQESREGDCIIPEVCSQESRGGGYRWIPA